MKNWENVHANFHFCFVIAGLVFTYFLEFFQGEGKFGWEVDGNVIIYTGLVINYVLKIYISLTYFPFFWRMSELTGQT